MPSTDYKLTEAEDQHLRVLFHGFSIEHPGFTEPHDFITYCESKRPLGEIAEAGLNKLDQMPASEFLKYVRSWKA